MIDYQAISDTKMHENILFSYMPLKNGSRWEIIDTDRHEI
jgi:hypothetical protein